LRRITAAAPIRSAADRDHCRAEPVAGLAGGTHIVGPLLWDPATSNCGHGRKRPLGARRRSTASSADPGLLDAALAIDGYGSWPMLQEYVASCAQSVRPVGPAGSADRRRRSYQRCRARHGRAVLAAGNRWCSFLAADQRELANRVARLHGNVVHRLSRLRGAVRLHACAIQVRRGRQRIAAGAGTVRSFGLVVRRFRDRAG